MRTLALRTALRTARVAAVVPLLLAAGCGISDPLSGFPPAIRLPAINACPAAPSPAEAATLVVLDWDGGTSVQVAGADLAPFSVSDLEFTDDVSAFADLDEAFHQAVLARVQAMLCALDPQDVAVVEGNGDALPNATVVHLTADAPSASTNHIGQGHFDPCNEHTDDAVVIWGGALASRIKQASFAEWVNAFANTAAHETGHTLGFAHPDEDALARALPFPAEEVMRGRVTIAALLGEQHFLYEQETCPGYQPGAGSYQLVIDELGE